MATPMMKQYNKLKAQNNDAILLFRLGDFYEAFDDDAKEIAKILNITLTGRGKSENRIPMAGIPHHAMKRYLKRLVRAGRKVAIAEQMEEPQAGKLVEREIVKIVTAGTISDIDYLDEAQNNYLSAIYEKDAIYHLAFTDLTTGEFHTISFGNFADLENEIYRLRTNEIITDDATKGKIERNSPHISITVPESEVWNAEKNYTLLKAHFKISNLKSFGYKKHDPELIPAGVIFDYLQQTQKSSLEHIKKITKINRSIYMNLDPATITNLELIHSRDQDKKDASLFGILNHCKTAMGQRKLRSWILNPLIKIEPLQKRLDAVDELISDPVKLSEIQEALDNICDLERVVSKIGTGSINARDLLYLKTSLEQIKRIEELTDKYKSELVNLLQNLSKKEQESIQSLVELIENSITDDPPNTIMEGGMIRQGHNAELDEIKKIETKGKDWLKELQVQESKSTGIASLKVKFNNVFGYYIEISKSNLDKVPEDYIRKQTLVNAERFVTEELKEWENKILNASDKANALEYEIFEFLRDEVANHIDLLQKLASIISSIDVFANFAQIARLNNYSKPTLTNSGKTEIVNGRHPVVEKFIEKKYIPNNFSMDGNSEQIMILTGPNMSGKSTFIRQTALISLLAQIGSFIPADPSTVTVLDRVFTRVGASDNLASGESTFMVEMNETANILNNATENSLIILDEVGRGTSTYDGVAIAWSIVEYIHEQIGAKTLFATHYHELIDLEEKMERVANYNVEVVEEKGEVKFTRKVVKGGTDQSYGVYVAEMAGVPEEIVKRSKEILMTLEQESMLDVKSIEGELIKKRQTKKRRGQKKHTSAKLAKVQLPLV